MLLFPSHLREGLGEGPRFSHRGQTLPRPLPQAGEASYETETLNSLIASLFETAPPSRLVA